MRELSQLAAVIVLAFVPALWAPGAAAELLVTHRGDVIETQGPWKVKGRQVVFTSEEGVLSSMRLSDVDLEASEETWKRRQEEAAAPPREEAEAPEPVKRKSVLVLTNDNLGGDSALEDAMAELGEAFGAAMGGMAEGMVRGMEEAFGEAEVTDELAAGVEGMGEAMQQGMEVMAEFMTVAIEIGLEANEIDQRHDLDTARGMRNAASDFDSLAYEVRGRKEGARPEIQKMLEEMAQQFEDLAALAREDPKAAVRKRRQKMAPDG